MSSGEKTEEPTPKKLREAREKGQVAQSRDVTSTALLIVIFAYIAVMWHPVLARLKADAGWSAQATEDAVVLAADTSVVLGEQILGKPKDAADGAAMLRMLSGRTHDVLTAVALRTAASSLRLSSAVTAKSSGTGPAFAGSRR